MTYKEDYEIAKKFFEETYQSDYSKRRLMYMGDHWNALLVGGNVSVDAAKPKINYIKPNVNYLLSMLSMENPTIVVEPEEQSDNPIAEGLSSLIGRIYEKRKVDKFSQFSIKDMVIYSKGYLGIRWNKDLDNGDGDVEPYFINPFNIYLEPAAYSLDDSYYAHIKWLKPKEYVYNKYKKEIPENGEDFFNSSKKGVEIIESWYKPCKEYPEGRHIIWTESEEEPLLDEETPYKNLYIPIIELAFDKISTGDAASIVEDMWGNQEVYMKTLGYIIDNLRYTNNGKYLTDWQDAPEKLPTAPNTILQMPQGSVFMPLTTPPISPAWFNLLTTAVATFPDISGVREVNMGTTSGGITAASAIVALQEATKTRRDDIKDKIIAPAMGDFGKYAVAIMQQFYTSDKIIKILEKPLEINDSKILDYDVEFQYSQALPTDKATRLNEAMQLVQLQLLDGEAFGELFDDPVLKKLLIETAKRREKQMAQQSEALAQQLQQKMRGAQQGTQPESPQGQENTLEGIGGR